MPGCGLDLLKQVVGFEKQSHDTDKTDEKENLIEDNEPAEKPGCTHRQIEQQAGLLA